MAGLTRAYKFALIGLVASYSLLAQAPAAAADGVKISSGLVDYQVLQRDHRGVGAAIFNGTAPARFNTRFVEARVTKESAEAVPWSVIGPIKTGKWTGSLPNIPMGGPYQIEVRVSTPQGPSPIVKVDNILVGDLWVLAGQSNMEGVGNLADASKPSGEVHSFDMTDIWGIAKDPLHTLPSAIDSVHWDKKVRLSGEDLEKFVANRTKGVGPGLSFAINMYQRTAIPVGLIPCAHGGTRMDQWDPAKKSEAGASLYGATLRRIQAVGGKIKGVLWYQGEADASVTLAPLFQSKFENLIQAFRTDTGQPDLPFYYVQIGLHVSNGTPAPWNDVQEAQRVVESKKMPNVGMAAAVDVALDDQIHVGGMDQLRIGRRLAALAAHDLYPDSAKENAAIKRGPRPVKAQYANRVIRVTFNEVNGQLIAEGRIAGFVVVNAENQPVPTIYKAKFDPKDGNVIDLETYGDIPPGSKLRYGVGRNPYCNVRDTADMALPVFGPFPIEGIPPAATAAPNTKP